MSNIALIRLKRNLIQFKNQQIKINNINIMLLLKIAGCMGGNFDETLSYIYSRYYICGERDPIRRS